MKKLNKLMLTIIGLTVAGQSLANGFCDQLSTAHKTNDLFVAMKMCNEPAKVEEFKKSIPPNAQEINVYTVSELLKLANANEAKLASKLQKNDNDYGTLLITGILKEIGKIQNSPKGSFVKVELQGKRNQIDYDTLTFYTPLVSASTDIPPDLLENSTNRMKYLIDKFEGQTNIPVDIACPPINYQKGFHNIELPMCFVIGANDQ